MLTDDSWSSLAMFDVMVRFQSLAILLFFLYRKVSVRMRNVFSCRIQLVKEALADDLSALRPKSHKN
ncbi:MAG: hypothetical protein NPIRA01_40350 [Nitrospirales bacterium]|nr:MAG: hypothetical protein NPIRA01_40350 [Nitrospirales bacterium]